MEVLVMNGVKIPTDGEILANTRHALYFGWVCPRCQRNLWGTHPDPDKKLLALLEEKADEFATAELRNFVEIFKNEVVEHLKEDCE